MFLLSLLIGIITGCIGQSTGSINPNELSNLSKNNEQINQLNRKIINTSIADSGTGDYTIGPGDLLDVDVYGSEDLKGQVRVNSMGVATYPLLGEVKLEGLTTQEAENKLQELLGAKYIKDPHVTVFIREYNSRRVGVIGAVKNPGNYELLNRGRLLDALALAGGLADNAGEVVYVTRGGSDQQVTINLYELLTMGNNDLNVPVQMGDTIVVPEAGVFYVNGAVRRPGDFVLTPGITFSQAIQVAGGVKSGAQNIRLVRFQNGATSVTPVDLKAIENGAEADIRLQDRDVIIVGQNAIVAFFQQFRVGLNFWPFPLNVSSSVPDVPQ